MAFLANQDEELANKGQVGQSTQPVVGGGSSTVGSGVSTAGVGKGGTGGWTNIQAYLNANPASSGSSSALKNEVGSAFDQEQSKIESDAGQVKAQADQTTSKNNPYSEAFGGMFNRYLQGDDTQADQIKKGMTEGYTGPNSYSYGMGSKTLNYSDQLNSDSGFNQLMGNLYNKAAGGQMSRGQLALQNQFDTNNPAISSAREELKGRFGALQSKANQTIGDTQDYLNQAANTYRDNQGSLGQYLNTQMNDAKSTYEAALANPTKLGDPAQYKTRFDRIAALLGVVPSTSTETATAPTSGKGTGGTSTWTDGKDPGYRVLF